MRIESVIFKDFAPFADSQIIFPAPEHGGRGDVHIFTGENGTGKTRMLCLLAAVLGNEAELKIRTDGAAGFITAGVTSIPNQWRHTRYGPAIGRHVQFARKAIVTGESDLSANWVGRGLRLGFETHADKYVSFEGRHEDWQSSPAAALAFRGMARVSDANVEALKPVKLGDAASHLIFEHARKDEDEIIGQSMTNIKMQAAMESSQNGPGSSGRYTMLAARIEKAVHHVTGRPFTFRVTPYPKVSLIVNWGGVSMRLALLPDGLRSIIGWMVACVAKLEAMYPEHPDPLSIPVVLLLDEPESHLHPAWQRKVIPAALALLSHAQIFVATHSPFLISSVNEGYIYIFRAGADGVVKIDAPQKCSPGDSYLDVVEDILGVKEWFDPESEELLAKFRGKMAEVTAGRWDHEDQLRQQAVEIAKRSPALNDLMGREMHQLETLNEGSRLLSD